MAVIVRLRLPDAVKDVREVEALPATAAVHALAGVQFHTTYSPVPIPVPTSHSAAAVASLAAAFSAAQPAAGVIRRRPDLQEGWAVPPPRARWHPGPGACRPSPHASRTSPP